MTMSKTGATLMVALAMLATASATAEAGEFRRMMPSGGMGRFGGMPGGPAMRPMGFGGPAFGGQRGFGGQRPPQFGAFGGGRGFGGGFAGRGPAFRGGGRDAAIGAAGLGLGLIVGGALAAQGSGAGVPVGTAGPDDVGGDAVGYGRACRRTPVMIQGRDGLYHDRVVNVCED